jgi:hypothetical protein
VRALLCSMFAWSQCAHSVTVVARSSGEGASLTSVLSVSVGSDIHSGGGTTGDGVPVAPVHSVGVSSVSHCGGDHDR